MRSRTWFAAAGALLVAAFLPAPAGAGVEPVPWHLLVSNRSDATPPELVQIHGQPLREIVVYLVVEDRPSDTGGGGTRVIPYRLEGLEIAAGGSVAIAMGQPTATGSVLGWGFTARMGVDPVPWRVYAMEGTPPAPEEPAGWPTLPAARLTPEFGLYAFASPGTLVGAVAMSTDDVYAWCKADDPWKNHGQYVRCVALRAGDLVDLGEVTEDEADAIVSAAARSSAGR